MKQFICLLGLLCSGCYASDRASFTSVMYNYKVTLYSGGQVVGSWETKGVPNNEEHSDGFYFVDRKSGKLIRISGTVIIEQIP